MKRKKKKDTIECMWHELTHNCNKGEKPEKAKAQTWSGESTHLRVEFENSRAAERRQRLKRAIFMQHQQIRQPLRLIVALPDRLRSQRRWR